MTIQFWMLPKVATPGERITEKIISSSGKNFPSARPRHSGDTRLLSKRTAVSVLKKTLDSSVQNFSASMLSF